MHGVCTTPVRGLYALLSLALALGSGCATHGAVSDVEDRIRRVESRLLTRNIVRGENPRPLTVEERLRFYQVPGVSVAVINDGRIEWARAWGETEAGGGVRVDTTTLFQAASISKPVTAAGVLQLVEDSSLELDQDVNRLLRSWNVPENEFTSANKVTLRRLLSHSAGTTVSGFPGYAAGVAVPSLTQVLNGEPPANTGAVRVDTAPGSRFRYSGGGTTIVQLLVADLTGQPFPDFMDRQVLDPAGMHRSTFAQPLPPKRAHEAATGHRRDGAPVPGKFHTYPEMAAAGLWSTPSDLARFAIEIQRALAGDSGRILSPGTAQMMVTPQANNYGLGFWVEGADDARWFSHGGSNMGFRSHLVASARGGRGAVVMTNGERGSDLADEILRAIAREYGWDIFKPNERDAVELGPETLAEFVGTYYAPWRGKDDAFALEVRLEDGTLHATLPLTGWSERPLRPSSETSFFLLDSGGELSFERDETGAVRAVVLSGLSETVRAVRR